MSLIDDFENSFQACLAPITNPLSSHVLDNDELKANVDNIQRFLDISQQIESFFIRKRAILSEQKPEITLNEEINELKSEINRKDILLNNYYEKLNMWSNMVNEALTGKTMHPNNMMIAENVNPTMMPGQQQPPPPSMRMGPSGMPVSTMPMNAGMQHVPNPLMRSQQSAVGGGAPSGMMLSNVPPPQMASANHPAHPQSSTGVYNPMQYPSNQNPLANLERTTAHIGMNDNRR
ncbi:mediator complex subunit 28 [Dermatophagoides pteronyssinus]|uniref:Mediator of RNA polymerase II transcription subunit 28 n=1 Tax=Dermatophagoides pteronyssinus TaxID=6956 RepID=A0A6P6YAJ4_DERPT|nr:mediator of RNA polymerase II transcription subunit 28-like [Dermatophagoides pteronyssinus]